MTLLPRSVVTLSLSAFCVVFACAQQPELAEGPTPVAASDFSARLSMNPSMGDPIGGDPIGGDPIGGDAIGDGNGLIRRPIEPSATGGLWFFRHVGLGTYTSPLGFGGRIAVSLTESLNLRVGGNYFSYTTKQISSNIPYTVHVLLQSEQAAFDWYPFGGRFHVSPGVLFGNSNRAYGSSTVPAGTSFTLNKVTYYSGAASPVQASGYVEFERVTPTLTVGLGNWVRHPWVRGEEGHWTFPFEGGVSFNGDPKTALNFSGVVCSSGQTFCRNIATDPTVQANIQVERGKLQNDANWLRFYPIIAGGIVYRF